MNNKKEIYEKVMQAVSKAVYEEIDRLYDEEVDVFKDFDINTIAKEDRERAWHIREYIRMKSLDNPLVESVLLNEAKTYPIHDALKYIKDKYHLQDWQASIDFRHEKVYFGIIIPHIDDIVLQLTTDMENMGYFLGSYSKGFADIDGHQWRTMQFEPKEQDNIREIIESEYDVIYHVTPVNNLSSIKKNGFIPHSSENYINRFSYPDRTFFIYSKSPIEDMCKMTNMQIRYKLSRGIEAWKRYAFIAVSLKKIPDYIKMYYDGNYDRGIFVEDNIPAKAINEIRIYNVKTKRFEKYTIWNHIADRILSMFRW
jgi:hypothetical protein